VLGVPSNPKAAKAMRTKGAIRFMREV